MAITIEAEPFFDGIETAPRFAVLRDGEYIGAVTYWTGRAHRYMADGAELRQTLGPVMSWRTLAEARAAIEIA